jgi:hypothetical protein
MRRRSFVVFELLLLLAGSATPPAYAADAKGTFALRGFGAQSCSAAGAAMKSDPQLAGVAIAWLQGYVTALNRVQQGTFDVSPLPDLTALLRMITGFCEKSPDTPVENVSFQVIRVLAAARVLEDTPIVQTKSGQANAMLRQETLVKVQQALISRGYLSGAADGQFGGQTAQALKSFQQAQGLPVTGVTDAATVVRLLIELPAQGKKSN